MDDRLVFFIAGILIGFIFGWFTRSRRVVPESEHMYFGTVKIDKSSQEKDIMAFEFKKSPGDIEKYKFIYFDVDLNADLSQDKTFF